MSSGEPISPREHILQAALRLFLSKGYSATSMRDIAAEAGQRAVAGIYNHFANKEAIFKALILERSPFEAVIAEMETIEAETAPEYIGILLTRLMPIVITYYDYIELIQIDMREFQSVHTRALISDRVIPQLIGIITRLQTLPGLKPIEPLVLLRLIVSLIVGFALTQRIAVPYLQILSNDEWIERYTNLYLYGVAASQPPDMQ